MSQGSLFTGQPVLSQLLQLIPKNLVDRLAKEHQADRYCKTLVKASVSPFSAHLTRAQFFNV
ncbi:MAG: DUF4372 domain-containing protein [Flavobacteriales bacterium]|nr:DUF4372 domain-containing protein [Flavobacteriales bacterium]